MEFVQAAGDAMREKMEKIKNVGITSEQIALTLQMFCGNKRTESNNWRKMHGLPMRRKQIT